MSNNGNLEKVGHGSSSNFMATIRDLLGKSSLFQEDKMSKQENKVQKISFRWSEWSDMTPEESKLFNEEGHVHLINLLEPLANEYGFQFEEGEITGVRHYQGEATMKKTIDGKDVRKRPKEYQSLFHKKCYGIQVQVCSNNGMQALIEYCKKGKTRIRGPWTKGGVLAYRGEDLPHEEELYEWQRDLVSIVKGPIHARTIYWIVGKKGGEGKTALAKYLCYHLKAVLLTYSNTRDLLAMAAEINSKLYVCDLTRAKPKDIGNQDLYSALEGIKNGLFMNSKYAVKQVMRSKPHVLVFSNHFPEYKCMSADRWNVWDLSKSKGPLSLDMNSPKAE